MITPLTCWFHNKNLVSYNLVDSFDANMFVDPENVIIDVAAWDEFATVCLLKSDESRSTIDNYLKLVTVDTRKTMCTTNVKSPLKLQTFAYVKENDDDNATDLGPLSWYHIWWEFMHVYDGRDWPHREKAWSSGIVFQWLILQKRILSCSIHRFLS